MNIQATVAYDQAGTSAMPSSSAVSFSILILLVLLRSGRATLISALAIPTTLAITFLFMYWAGATLNLMSLGGLNRTPTHDEVIGIDSLGNVDLACVERWMVNSAT